MKNYHPKPIFVTENIFINCKAKQSDLTGPVYASQHFMTENMTASFHCGKKNYGSSEMIHLIWLNLL